MYRKANNTKDSPVWKILKFRVQIWIVCSNKEILISAGIKRWSRIDLGSSKRSTSFYEEAMVPRALPQADLHRHTPTTTTTTAQLQSKHVLTKAFRLEPMQKHFPIWWWSFKHWDLSICLGLKLCFSHKCMQRLWICYKTKGNIKILSSSTGLTKDENMSKFWVFHSLHQSALLYI